MEQSVTRFYTANGNLAKTIVKFPQVVDGVMKDIKINPDDIQKTHLTALKLFHRKSLTALTLMLRELYLRLKKLNRRLFRWDLS